MAGFIGALFDVGLMGADVSWHLYNAGRSLPGTSYRFSLR